MSAAKRSLDLSLSVCGLLLLSPLFLVIAVLIKAEDGGPVFFSQKRAGFGGTPFTIWKFRTMVTDAESLGPHLTSSGDPRITRIGARLRARKLDELPQLFNVVLGEMSLVGPRPEVPRYVAMYTPEQRKVLELVPGITDRASLAFADEGARLAASAEPERLYIDRIMPEKIRINLEYARNASVLNDLRIIFGTVGHLVRPTRATYALFVP